MSKAELAAKVIELSSQVNKIAKNRNAKRLAAFTSAAERKALGDVYFLGAASAKVIHSTQELGYVNVVQYLAPADRAAMAFLYEHEEVRREVLRTGRIQKLDDAFTAAAKHEPLWGAFAGSSGTLAKGQAQLLQHVVDSAKENPQYTLPDFRNRFLSLCPFASPDCRAVCLNTSGQGGMARTDELGPVARAAAQAGYTHTTDTQYLYLKGYKAFFGGESNSVTGARIRRTHVMLLSWMREGILESTYNEMILEEAQIFAEKARVLKLPMALRLNGTSDFPAHTLRVKGRSLMEVMHGQDVVCYDYTKHYQKMKAWMDAKAFDPKAHPTVKRGFPVNYHLVFSWSENNARRCLDVLRGGGNVVMVFRRSVKAGKAGDVLPTKATGKGVLPNRIALAQLSPEKNDRLWEADVVNGDAHDLRFLDPYKVGQENAGLIVGLVAKGSAIKPYGAAERRQTFQHFTSPVMLRRIGEQVKAEIVENPGELGAVQEVDSGLAKQSTVHVDGWDIMPTNLAT